MSCKLLQKYLDSNFSFSSHTSEDFEALENETNNEHGDWDDSGWDWDLTESDGHQKSSFSKSQCSQISEQTLLSVSSFSDVFAIAVDDTLSIFTGSTTKEKWSLTFSGKISFDISNDSVTSILIIPISAVRRSSHGVPDWSCIAVGYKSGFIRFFTENGTLLLSQLLHFDSVLDMTCHSFEPSKKDTPDKIEELTILYRHTVVFIDGFNLVQVLHACRSQAARVQASGGGDVIPPLLSYKKWGLGGQKQTVAHASTGLCSPPSLLSDMISKSITMGHVSYTDDNRLEKRKGGYLQTEGGISSFYLLGGTLPFLAFFKASELVSHPHLSDVAYSMAKKFTSAFFSSASEWWSGSSQLSANSKNSRSQQMSSNPSLDPVSAAALTLPKGTKMEPPTSISMKYRISDNILEGSGEGRKVTQMMMSPCRSMVAVADSFGRILLVKGESAAVLRMWKGYREAQIGWIRVREPKSSASKRRKTTDSLKIFTSSTSRTAQFLVIYVPRQKLLEIWKTVYGPRVAVFKIDEPHRLLCMNYGLFGIGNTSSLDTDIIGSQCILFNLKNASLQEIVVPFHLAMTDCSSQKAHDDHVFREIKSFLSSLSRESKIDQETYIATLVKYLSHFKTSSIRRKALDLVIRSTEITPEVVEEILQRRIDNLEILHESKRQQHLKEEKKDSDDSAFPKELLMHMKYCEAQQTLIKLYIKISQYERETVEEMCSEESATDLSTILTSLINCHEDDASRIGNTFERMKRIEELHGKGSDGDEKMNNEQKEKPHQQQKVHFEHHDEDMEKHVNTETQDVTDDKMNLGQFLSCFECNVNRVNETSSGYQFKITPSAQLRDQLRLLLSTFIFGKALTSTRIAIRLVADIHSSSISLSSMLDLLTQSWLSSDDRCLDSLSLSFQSLYILVKSFMFLLPSGIVVVRDTTLPHTIMDDTLRKDNDVVADEKTTQAASSSKPTTTDLTVEKNMRRLSEEEIFSEGDLNTTSPSNVPSSSVYYYSDSAFSNFSDSETKMDPLKIQSDTLMKFHLMCQKSTSVYSALILALILRKILIYLLLRKSSSSIEDDDEMNGNEFVENDILTDDKIDLADWESVNSDVEKWSVLIQQLEDCAVLKSLIQLAYLESSSESSTEIKLDNNIQRNGKNIMETKQLKARRTNADNSFGENKATTSHIDDISVSRLLENGHGYISDLISKWIVRNRLSTRRLKSFLLTTVDSSSNDDNHESIIRTIFSDLQERLPVSLNHEGLFVNCAWEYFALWHREQFSIENLADMAMEYVELITISRLQHGMLIMVWEAFVMSTISKVSSLLEKMGKCPKERIIRKEIGIITANHLANFLTFVFEKLLPTILAANVNMTEEQYEREKYPVRRFEDEHGDIVIPPNAGDKASASNSWIMLSDMEDLKGTSKLEFGVWSIVDQRLLWTSPAKDSKQLSTNQRQSRQGPKQLPEIAACQKMTNYGLVEHHRIITAVLAAIVTFAMTKIKPLQDLFDERGQKAYKEKLTHYPYIPPNSFLDELLLHKRLEFWKRVIVHAVKLKQNALRRQDLPTPSESSSDVNDIKMNKKDSGIEDNSISLSNTADDQSSYFCSVADKWIDVSIEIGSLMLTKPSKLHLHHVHQLFHHFLDDIGYKAWRSLEENEFYVNSDDDTTSDNPADVGEHFPKYKKPSVELDVGQQSHNPRKSDIVEGAMLALLTHVASIRIGWIIFNQNITMAPDLLSRLSTPVSKTLQSIFELRNETINFNDVITIPDISILLLKLIERYESNRKVLRVFMNNKKVLLDYLENGDISNVLNLNLSTFGIRYLQELYELVQFLH